VIRSKPFLTTVPSSFTAAYRERVKTMSLRESDVWVVTFPKESSTLPTTLLMVQSEVTLP
jgi:hypothetical protein